MTKCNLLYSVHINFFISLLYSMMLLLARIWEVDIIAILIGSGSISGLFLVFYWILKHEYSYWERRGFETHPEFIYILGHFKKLLINRICFADFVNQLYKSSNEPFVGIYGIFRSMLLVRDPKLIQSILIKDFSYFTDRKQNSSFSIITDYHVGCMSWLSTICLLI